MKKVIFENGFRAFWTAALLLVLGVVSVQAQSLSTTASGGGNPQGAISVGGGIPQGNFVSSSEALTLLDATMVDLKDQMVASGLDPYDPIFLAMQAKYKYLRAIRESIVNGDNTATAIVQGMVVFTQPELYYVTPNAQAQLKQEAIDLLS